MSTHLEQDLRGITAKIFMMADLAIESIRNSIESLKNQDLKLAELVLQRDNELDRLEVLIDEECIRLLVTRQPAAADLRLILTILKTNTDLERIGDLSTNIAKETLGSLGKPLLKPLVDIPRMGDIAINMITMAFRAISEKDQSLAREIIEMDRQVDDINMQIYRELFSYMAENPSSISPALGLIMVAKALERIGDHATNIAERAIYYIEGEDIRHQE